MAGAPPPTEIPTSARAEDDRLILSVLDSGKGKTEDQDSGGIGLTNVRQRLEMIYGSNRAMFCAGRDKDGSFKAEIRLPLEFS